MLIEVSALILVLAAPVSTSSETDRCDCTESIVARLDDPDPGVRYWAGRVVGAVGDACYAVPALAREATNTTAGVDPEGSVRITMHPDGSETVALSESREGNTLYRESMIDALGRSGDDGAAILVELYHADLARTRESTSSKIEDVDGHRVVFAGDNSDVTRRAIVRAMAGGPATPLRVDFLLGVLDDEEVATAAAEILITSAPSLAEAAVIYRDHVARTEGEFARRWALETLLVRGQTAADSGLEELCPLVPVCLDALDDSSSEIRTYAVRGLSAFGGCGSEVEAQFEAVTQLDPEREVRDAAEEALLRIQAPSLTGGHRFGSGGGGCMEYGQPWTGEHALAFLDETLRSECPEVRKAALAALEIAGIADIVAPSLEPAFRTLLGDDDVTIRRLAVARLRNVFDLFGHENEEPFPIERFLEVLAPALRDPDPEVRREALFQLVRCEALPDADVLAAADRALGDPDPKVRAAGIYLISSIERSVVITARLLRAIADPDDDVASSAALAFSDRWNTKSMDGQTAEAIARRSASPSPDVRKFVALALAAALADGIATTWETLEQLARDEHADVREEVARGLFDIVDSGDSTPYGAAVTELLEQLALDPFPRVRNVAVEALARR